MTRHAGHVKKNSLITKLLINKKNNMSDKKYVGNAKVITTQYGDLMKISMTEADVKTLQESLENGWVNVAVKERREPSPTGLTHYLEIDNWKPNPREEAKEQPKGDPAFEDDISVDDLPF